MLFMYNEPLIILSLLYKFLIIFNVNHAYSPLSESGIMFSQRSLRLLIECDLCFSQTILYFQYLAYN
jgi:hypothetical protein